MKNYFISIYLDARRTKSNGKYPVKLRVYISHPKEQKLYPTEFEFNIETFDSIWNTAKPRRQYQETRNKLKILELKAIEIADKLNPFNFEDFEKNLLRKVSDRTKLNYQYEIKIEELEKQNQIATASNYKLSQKSIIDFSEKVKAKKYANLTLYDITPRWLDEYEYYMLNQKERSSTTVSMYIRALRTIFNRAIEDNELDRKYYPFGIRKYQVPSSTKVKKALTKDQLKKLYELIPKNEFEEKAKDFWFLSYACNGININDIALLKFKNIDTDKVSFYRAKTNRTSKANLKPISFFLNEFSNSIIVKYGNEKNTENYIFNIISEGDSAQEQKRKVQNFTRYINQHIKKLCKDNDLPEDISTYWARHSFATNSIRNGASMEFVSESLGHSGLSITKEYFAGFDNDTKKKFSDSIMDFG